MRVSFKRAFIKDLRKIPANLKVAIEAFAFEEATSVEGLEGLANIQPITGHSGYFRKRFGDYRVGFKAGGDEIIFYRVLHRKDIYRYFP